MSSFAETGLTPLQEWALDQFHFAPIASGTPRDQTPLANMARGDAEEMLSNPRFLDIARIARIHPGELQTLLASAFKAVEESAG